MSDPLFPLLPHLPAARIRACYDAAPGNEIASGKFASPESSAALAANVWGFFIEEPAALPRLPGGSDQRAWGVRSVTCEAIVRFAWSGGRHPCLDVRVDTDAEVIGVESKRYEPFRWHGAPKLSEAYWRPVWGERMERYCAMRDRLRDEPHAFQHLDATQLVKHAFGLRSEAAREGRIARLLYVFAEPVTWANGKRVPPEDIARHRAETEAFAVAVDGDEVAFSWTTYRALLEGWREHASASAHANAVLDAFDL